MRTLTRVQAELLVDAWDINMDPRDEETEMLEENNPDLAAAYRVLLAIAEGN